MPKGYAKWHTASRRMAVAVDCAHEPSRCAPSYHIFMTRFQTFGAFALAIVLGGCAGQRAAPMTASEGRALIASYLPASLADKEGWAADIYTPMAVLEIPLTPDNICAILSITEQETGFRVDPAIPNLTKITWAEIERRREKIGIPAIVLDAALAIRSN